ncbi:MAG: helix-turn-helix transcriptional regulator [Chitinophagales bacterium]
MMPVSLSAEKMFIKNAGYLLRKTRLQLCLTRTQVSASTGLTRKCINDVEMSHNRCKLETYLTLAKAYNLPDTFIHYNYTTIPTAAQLYQLEHWQALQNSYHRAKNKNKERFAQKLKSLCFLTVDLTKPLNEPGVQLELVLVEEKKGKTTPRKK